MDLHQRARSLRQRQTNAEQKLWHHLRRRQIGGYKFRRQHVFEPYIVDFVRLELKLIVELDGGQHADAVEYDEKRSKYLKQHGFKVVRFWNNQVLGELSSVLEALTLTLSQREREIKNSET